MVYTYEAALMSTAARTVIQLTLCNGTDPARSRVCWPFCEMARELPTVLPLLCPQQQDTPDRVRARMHMYCTTPAGMLSRPPAQGLPRPGLKTDIAMQCSPPAQTSRPSEDGLTMRALLNIALDCNSSSLALGQTGLSC